MAIVEPGKVVAVDEIPQCDFCEADGKYDFKTMMGPWAHGCSYHWRMYRQYPTLGVGKAQMWVVQGARK
jgi:hypothetical protein